jgi:TonB-dependent SusC/RagA subfamily outer membrane receptor
MNLNFLSPNEAVDLAGKAENILIDLVVAGQKLSINQRLSDLNEDTLLLSGIIPSAEKNTMVLAYGNTGNIHEEESIEITYNNTCQESLLDRIDMLSVFENYAKNNSDWRNILEYGKKEKVVTQSTSYIVLEKIEDYIKYNILPPKELESQCDMNQFVKADKDRMDQYKKQDEFEKLSEVATAYNDRITWWDKKEPVITLTEEKPEQVIVEEKKEMQPGRIPVATPLVRTALQDIPEGAKFVMGTEVVVTALGQTRQPRELGYAISKVKSQELTWAKSVNVQNELTGKVSGLNVQTVNSGVFANTRITLRGIRSLTGNNQPLIVFDGVPVDIRFLSLMNPNDIREVTILKGTAGAAIYGPDGVNGAILITTKVGSRFSPYYQSRERYRLKDQDDMDYSVEFRSVPDKDKIDKYHEMKNNYRDNAGFYFDIAQDLFEAGYRKEALDILYTAADITNGDWQTLKAIGYTLESWKKFDEAISLYKLMLSENENDLQTCRDLALTCYQKGNFQQAVDIFYKGIMNDDPNKELKAMMLQEMNAIIAVQKEKLDLSKINRQFIRPLTVDLRITFECNTTNLSNKVSIAEPGGTACSAKKPLSMYGGRLTIKNAVNRANNIYTVAPEEYQIKNAVDGKYKLRISYTGFNGYIYNARIPTMIKMTTFKNFGKPGQSIKIENVIMDYQYGDVEIGTVKW